MYFPLSIERTLMLERHQCLNTTSSNVHFREVVVVDSRGKIKIIFSSLALELCSYSQVNYIIKRKIKINFHHRSKVRRLSNTVNQIPVISP